MKQLISVIVPFYNAKEYLKECIESVLKQTYDNWELILINDGSTDNSIEICEEFAKENKNIYLYSKKNTGVSETRNIGIEKASGDWITFLDADDKIKENFLEESVKLIESQNCDIIIGEVNTTKGNNFLINKSIIYEDFEKETIIKELLTGYNKKNFSYNPRMLGFVPGKVYKREIIKDIKFPSGIRFREDMIFNLQAFERANKIIITPNLIYIYVINLKSTTFKYFENYTSEIERFEKNVENIICNIKIDLKQEFYICMINMYMNWLKLYVMHEKTSFSKKMQIKEIKKSFKEILWKNVFQNVKYSNLTRQYKILYILYNFKSERLIYLITKFNIYINKKKYNI